LPPNAEGAASDGKPLSVKCDCIISVIHAFQAVEIFIYQTPGIRFMLVAFRKFITALMTVNNIPFSIDDTDE